MSDALKFKPRILGMICNWCCYGGADLCGVSRFHYPPYIRLIRVMCSARVDLMHVITAFLTGQDAVFIGGCHLNDCHYITNGNYDALSMATICKKLLKHIGLNPGRLRLEWVSAGEGIRFANIMNEFGRQVEGFGPIGKSEGIEPDLLRLKLESIKRLIPYIRLVQTERMRLPHKSEEAYEIFLKSDDFERLFNELISDKLAVSQMLLLLGESPLSIGEIANRMQLTSSEASRHLYSSSRQGLARYDESIKRFAPA